MSEYAQIEILGTEKGIERKKINLINPKKENVLKKAQSYFSIDEKKIAKLNHKNSLLN